MEAKPTKRLVLYLLLASLLTGAVFNLFYNYLPTQVLQIGVFQQMLEKRQQVAETTLHTLEQYVMKGQLQKVFHFPYRKLTTTYILQKNGKNIFWSKNYIDFDQIKVSDKPYWQYILLPNAHCIYKTVQYKNYRIIALLKVKNNYQFENSTLQNDFSTWANLNKEVKIYLGKMSDRFAVTDHHNTYLFSLEPVENATQNEIFLLIATCAYLFAFAMVFLLYTRFPFFFELKSLSLIHYSYVFLSVGAIIMVCLKFNIPDILFLSPYFSPVLYSSNPILGSLLHLSVFVFFFFCSARLFHKHTYITNRNSRRILQIVLVANACFFAIFYFTVRGILIHSSIQVNILTFHNVNFSALWIHLLIILLGLGQVMMYFKSHNPFYTSRKLYQAIITDLCLTGFLYLLFLIYSEDDAIRASISYFLLSSIFYLRYLIGRVKNRLTYWAIWTFAISLFFASNSYLIVKNKQQAKFKLLAQNIAVNGTSDNDEMIDFLLKDLDIKIKDDLDDRLISSNHDSILIVTDYLNKKYMRGFLNKFEIRLNIARSSSNMARQYKMFIAKSGSLIPNTHFYNVPSHEGSMTYLAEFREPIPDSQDSIIYYMEFFPRTNFHSYSFPNLLAPSTAGIQEKLKISIAKYDNNHLVYNSGNFSYPLENNWIKRKFPEFYDIQYEEKTHHIYVADNHTFIVITEEDSYITVQYYLVYMLYFFISFFVDCWVANILNRISSNRNAFQYKLSARFQNRLIILIIVSFVSIYYASVSFMEQKYRKDQITELENKKRYIQKALQDRYFWTENLNEGNCQSLNFDLQDLASIYHTDIHVYNNLGILVGSSQPLLFYKDLLSDHINPGAFFTSTGNIDLYEFIGNQKYLSGYTPFINGDYLPIGYINIPQFYSQSEISSETEKFMTLITHIFTLATIIALFLSMYVSRQMTAPLVILEKKLREMRLGHKNQKIRYNHNDEISQLVNQYNRTVDELEQSARLLAKSERETAWKTMARQVAHEINNPLTPMKLSIQQLQRTKQMNDNRFDDYFDRSTQMLIEQINNLSRIAGSFSSFAKMPDANFSRVDVASKVAGVVQLFANNAEDIKVLYTGEKEGVFVYADGEQLVQVFNNIIKNAIQAIPETKEGLVQVRLYLVETNIIIEIQDNGCGVSEEQKDKLFIPSFTTKSTGMGLGLAICKNIIDITGGGLSFESTVDVGTTFSIKLPMA